MVWRRSTRSVRDSPCTLSAPVCDPLGREALAQDELLDLAGGGQGELVDEGLDEVRKVTTLLVESAEEERRRLETILGEIYETAALIPLGKDVAREAQGQQTSRGLGPQDALVYASILAHMQGSVVSNPTAEQRGCFVTRDRDFADEDVRADLEGLGCKLLFKFDTALRYVRSHLS